MDKTNRPDKASNNTAQTPGVQPQAKPLEKQAGPERLSIARAVSAATAPSDASPPARRTDGEMPGREEMGAAGRARVMRAMQGAVGNARVGEMVAEPPAAGTPANLPATSVPTIQRKCACGGEAGPDGECAACKARRAAVQRQAAAAGRPEQLPGSVQTALSSGGGQALPPATRAPLEEKMGADFSGVRVHTGSQAARAAKDIDAHAFTHGQDVFFGEGKF